MRKLLWAMAALLAILLVAGGAAGWYVRSAAPVTAGRATAHGLRKPVEVWRDSMGVPHIWARSEEDAVYAQGYVHAQDRLWQMEMFRRVAQGRLAEVIGPEGVDTDRFLRTLGMWRATAEAERRLDPAERRLLEAYAAGVNAYLQDRRGALPPEFLALRVTPEPWTVRSSLAIEKVMAWDLASYNVGVALFHDLRRLGVERGRILMPDYPAFNPTILEGPAPPAVPAVAAALLDAASTVHASNSWVISGRLTRSGKPILANDMHLGLRAPSIWQLQALHGGALDVAGMTLPGVPYVVAGHNRAVAWGYTNAMLDDADLFLEKLDPADSTRYLVPGGSEPFRVLVDTIRVKGRERPELLRIRWTRHGPILTDVEARADTQLLALRWAAHDPSPSYRAIRGLNLARQWSDFLAAVAEFRDPHQNVIYADTAGHIGYAMAGRVPLRGSADPARAKRPPLLPVPGWTGEWDWRGDLPFAQHPQALDPPEGYIVTANNRQAAGTVADLVTGEWDEGFRAYRIREMIRGDGAPPQGPVVGAGLPEPPAAPARRLDAAAILAMQLDTHDAMAARYLDRAVAAAERAGLGDEARLLRAWDADAAADSRAAALFYAWYERLRHLEAVSLYGGSGGDFGRSAANRLLEARALPWERREARAAFEELAARAMREAAPVTRGKTWGELNRVMIEHPLGQVAALQRLFGFSIGPAPRAGSPTTVNVSHYGGWRFPATTTAGPSERHVVDMGDVDGAGGFVLPTGESGIPFEAHYRDMFDMWQKGGLWR
ncbi:MAG TPA: penicillin acylase family protein, partial [Longimicrobiales bacterium]|nr:penicillin acylase family protein [Longimicrobiales bacterium]